jgi:N-acetylneuraminate synthase
MTHWLRDPVPGRPCSIIGEVAQAHDGSLGMAHSFIDAIAAGGADAVKFQTHIAAAESTLAEPWRARFSKQDDTRLDYWRRMEFTPEQWAGLKTHAEEKGMVFLSSPFSPEAVDLLERLGITAWKVASGEINNLPLLERMAKSKLPVMMSTGMSALPEVDAAVEVVVKAGAPLCVMQCASLYPCPPESVGLNNVPLFRERYGTAVGLSDHSATIFPGLAAATLGIEALEVHVTLSREMFGPDVVASVTTAEFAELCRGVRMIEKMKASPVDKAAVPERIAPLRDIFMKSVVAAADLKAGVVLSEANLAAKKPGSGIRASQMGSLFGRKLARAVERDQMIAPEDLEPAA